MGFIRKFLGTLIVMAIVTAAVSFAVTDRLLNFKYLETKAGTTELYADLAKTIPELIARDEGNSAPAAQEAIAEIISPAYMETKLGGFLDQLQEYYRNDGPTPVLDLRDVAIQARAAGLVVPPDSTLDKPIEFSDPTGLKPQYERAQATKLYAPIVAIVLLVLLMLTLPAPARYRSAGKTLLAAALAIGGLFLFAKILPGVIKSLIEANPDLGPIMPPLTKLFEAIGSDIAADLLKIAVGLIGLAFAFFLFSIFGHKIGRSGGHEIKPQRPSPNSRPRLS